MGYLLAGVTFVVVVCGNSNEKRKKKKSKTKPKKLFFLQKGGINIIFLYGTTKALPTRIRFSFFFFFSRFSLPPTRIREKRSRKTHLFKNALQRGDFRKSRLVLYVLKGENGGFPIQ